jgi:hypothetical protein
MTTQNENSIILYQAENGQIKVDVVFNAETVWHI